MEPLSYVRYVAALALVLGLILALVWTFKRFGPAGMGGGLASKRRLAVIESLILDSKHRLVLVRFDRSEHLLVLGGAAVSLPLAVRNAEPAEDGPEDRS